LEIIINDGREAEYPNKFMNERIEYPDDDSLLVHFNQGEIETANAERGTWNGERKTKTIRIEASERTRCEVWSRVMGYFRPTDSYNIGKKQEFKDRQYFNAEVRPPSSQLGRTMEGREIIPGRPEITSGEELAKI